MPDAEIHARGQERSQGPAPLSRDATTNVASARTSIEVTATAEPKRVSRFSALPARAVVACAGASGICAVVIGAVVLRSAESIDALEQQQQAPTTSVQATSPSAQALPQKGTSSAAPPAPTSAGDAKQGADSAPQPGAQTPQADAKAPTEIALPEGEGATEVELTSARATGSVALEQLLKRYPRDMRVLKALVSAYSLQKNHAGAVSSAARLLAAAPSYAEDADLDQAILMAANGPPNASAVALDLLATKMRARGPDLLYEIVIAPGFGKLPKDRAARLLRDPAVRQLATPALLIALDLKNTPPCARKELYGRAREHGDGRALAFLKPMMVATGCGFLKRNDCFSCIEPRKDLADTVAAIQKRIGPTAPGR
jgi:hypothetical protein